MRIRPLVIALCALLAASAAFRRLNAADAGLVITKYHIGETPVTVFRLRDAPPGPVVAIAHGFAGSRPLMRGFATTLARNGYVAATFDFPGHGRNPNPLTGDLTIPDGATQRLVDELAEVAARLRVAPHGDGRLAVLGHSMAGDVIVRFARAHPEVAATVAVSMFSPAVTADEPRNLLMIAGDWEPGLKAEALRALRLTAGEDAAAGRTYGAFGDGSARRVAFAPHAEHIGVLYSPAAMAEALGWLNATFGHSGAGHIDARGPWVLLLIGAMTALAAPLSRLLPRVAAAGQGSGLRDARLILAVLGPMLATPLILSQVHVRFLPVVVGDYLAMHFALYGFLTASGLWLAGARTPRRDLRWAALALAALAIGAYAFAGIGLPIDAYVSSFMPIPARLPLMAALLAGTIPYFLADEWLTRGPDAPRWAYGASKLCFLLSLGVGVALDPPRLFFLLILAPALTLFFIVFGLFSAWAYRRTFHPFAGGLANAAIFAHAIAATFPMVAG